MTDVSNTDMSKLLAEAPQLKGWPLPKWIVAAASEIGQREVEGAKSNPRIIEYRKVSQIDLPGDDGIVPWCAIFVNAMLARAGVKGSGSGMARSFAASIGFERLSQPIVGCVTVISSNRGAASGHVFFYTGENGLMFQALGGNQDDAVSVSMFQKRRLVGHFWPKGVPHPAQPYDKPVKVAPPRGKKVAAAAREAKDA